MIYTIGYAGRSLEDLIYLLQNNMIDIVIDVRSIPYSASEYMKVFDADNLKISLPANGIRYLQAPKAFGARREEIEVYTENQVDFLKVPYTQSYKEGVKRLNRFISDNLNVCLMCSEMEPLNCHRFSMIARDLSKNGYNLRHILADGKIEQQQETENRLLSLFKNVSLEQAYRYLNNKIGFKIERLTEVVK